MRRLIPLLGTAAVAYALVVLLAWALQERLIWFPAGPPDVDPGVRGWAFEDVALTTEDGVALHGWWIPPDGELRGAVLVCHGNAGNVANRLEHAAAFRAMGYAVLLFDYRGYGRSEGSPSEDGTYLDAEAAWVRVVDGYGIAPSALVVYGESLGCAVAVELVLRREAGALMIESAFTSIPDVGAAAYPWLPIRWLSRVSYANEDKIERVGMPLLVAHSPHDEIVPFEHGAALYARARDPKEMLETSGGHNGGGFLASAAHRARVASFLARALRD